MRTASCPESSDGSIFGRLHVLHGDKCSKRCFAPLAKLLSRFKTFPGRLGMWGRHRRVDEVNIMQNQPSLDCKSLSSLSVLPFLSGFLRQSFIGTLLYEMLWPEFPFMRSKKLWTRFLPIFGRCHNRHVTLVADGRPLPYKFYGAFSQV